MFVALVFCARSDSPPLHCCAWLCPSCSAFDSPGVHHLSPAPPLLLRLAYLLQCTRLIPCARLMPGAGRAPLLIDFSSRSCAPCHMVAASACEAVPFWAVIKLGSPAPVFRTFPLCWPACFPCRQTLTPAAAQWAVSGHVRLLLHPPLTITQLLYWLPQQALKPLPGPAARAHFLCCFLCPSR